MARIWRVSSDFISCYIHRFTRSSFSVHGLCFAVRNPTKPGPLVSRHSPYTSQTSETANKQHGIFRFVYAVSLQQFRVTVSLYVQSRCHTQHNYVARRPCLPACRVHYAWVSVIRVCAAVSVHWGAMISKLTAGEHAVIYGAVWARLDRWFGAPGRRPARRHPPPPFHITKPTYPPPLLGCVRVENTG